MKNFEKPSCEVIWFDNAVIATSACGCYDEDMGILPKNCTGDVGYCSCTVNHNPAGDNCTPCGAHGE